MAMKMFKVNFIKGILRLHMTVSFAFEAVIREKERRKIDLTDLSQGPSNSLSVIILLLLVKIKPQKRLEGQTSK